MSDQQQMVPIMFEVHVADPNKVLDEARILAADYLNTTAAEVQVELAPGRVLDKTMNNKPIMWAFDCIAFRQPPF